MKQLTVILMLFAATITAAWGAEIGSWNCYLAYSNITEIQPAGKIVYVLSSKGLFAYNTEDNSIQSYDKINALSDCNIAHIAYCKAAKRLVIVYENQNIDLLNDNGHVVNISDYYNKSITADKTINEVKIEGSTAYISTSFGILKVNVADAEISATYNLGLKVLSTATWNNTIYASCENNGIIRAKLSDNLLDKKYWEKEADFTPSFLTSYDNSLLAVNNGNIRCKNNGGWELIYQYAFNFCNITGGKFIFGRENSAFILDGKDNPTTVSLDGMQLKTLVYDSQNKCYWCNQNNGKLCSIDINDNEVKRILTEIAPDGPKYNYFGYLKHYNNTLYSCGGGFDSFAELFREATVQTYDGNDWTIYQDDMKGKLGNLFQDMTCLDIDPKNPKHVFVGGREGLYEFEDGKFVEFYNAENSPLGYALSSNSPNYILTLGIKFDKSGNLWCLNSQSQKSPILELTPEGNWESYDKDILMNDDRSLPNLKCMILDSRGLLWFVNNHWTVPSFFCFNPSNGSMNHYTQFINEDGTRLGPTGVRCICEDLDGNIWIGTNVGPLMLPADEVTNGSNNVLQQIKVPRNDGTNYADYLLSGADITCIAVDGGNRKWFGTNGNGVYLISDDNMTQIQHFLTSNSLLLSNNIESITINNQTGEVFFGTDNGLCSYMSDATETNQTMTKDNVYAYPNPVTPDYTGMITVVGLTMDADVKIVTTNGTLVAEGRSNGGSFTWDGCDKKGHRVASGIYMVQTATSDGKKGTVCKIAIVN